MTAGEGGLVLTSGEELAKTCHAYVDCGRLRPGDAAPKAQGIFGWNYRMTEFQAAVLRVQLERLPEQQRVREANKAYLTERLQQIVGVETLRDDDRITTKSGLRLLLQVPKRRAAAGRRATSSLSGCATRASRRRGHVLRAGVSRQAVRLARHERWCGLQQRLVPDRGASGLRAERLAAAPDLPSARARMWTMWCGRSREGGSGVSGVGRGEVLRAGPKPDSTGSELTDLRNRCRSC